MTEQNSKRLLQNEIIIQILSFDLPERDILTQPNKLKAKTKRKTVSNNINSRGEGAY